MEVTIQHEINYLDKKSIYVTSYVINYNAAASLLARARTVKHTSSGSRAIYSLQTRAASSNNVSGLVGP